MANEVIVEEYGEQMYKTDGHLSGVAIGEKITTQVLDIEERSAQLDARTAYVVIQSKGTGFWLNEGDATVDATANADGNRYVPADGSKEFPVTKDIKHINTIADA